MNYVEYLQKIKMFSSSTIIVYAKYANELENYKLDYQKMLLNKNHSSRSTRRLVASAIISYYKFLNDKHWKEIELPKKEIIYKKFVSYEEYKNYLTKINSKTKMGFQKRLIIRLLFETGIRSQELLSIQKKDIKENKIKIYGKGKRQRVVKLSNWLMDELNQYCKSRENKLFNFKYKNLYAKITSLDTTKKLGPHMFRRGYAKYCFEKGAAIYDISLSMGHSSIETTASYIKRDSVDVELYKLFN